MFSSFTRACPSLSPTLNPSGALTLDEHVEAVLASPTATMRVIKQALAMRRRGDLDAPRWDRLRTYLAYDIHADLRASVTPPPAPRRSLFPTR